MVPNADYIVFDTAGLMTAGNVCLCVCTVKSLITRGYSLAVALGVVCRGISDSYTF